MPRVTMVNSKNVTKKLQKGDVIEFQIMGTQVEVYITRRKQRLHFVREADGEKTCSLFYGFRFDYPHEVMSFMAKLISLTTNREVETVSIRSYGTVRDGEYKVRLQ